MIIRGKIGGVILRFGSLEEKARLYELDEHLERNPDDVDALIEFGALCSVVFEGPGDAIIALKKAIELDDKNIEAYYWIGRTYLFDCSDGGSAKKYLEKAVLLDIDNFDTQYLLAKAIDLVHDVQIELAIDYVKKYPSFVASYINLGHAFLHHNNISGAKCALRDAYRLEDLLVKKRFYSRRTERYYRIFMEALVEVSGAYILSSVIEAKERNSDIGVVKSMLRKMSFWKKSSERDTTYSYKSISADGEDKIEERRRREEEKLVSLKMHLGWYEDVDRFEELKSHLNKNPDDVDALVEFGALCSVIFEGSREVKKALNRALEIEPKNIEAHFWLVVTLFYLHPIDLERAIKILEKALRLDGKCYELQIMMVRIFERKFLWNVEKNAESILMVKEKHPGWLVSHIMIGKHRLLLRDFAGAGRAVEIARDIEYGLERIKFKQCMERYYKKFRLKYDHSCLIPILSRDINYKGHSYNSSLVGIFSNLVRKVFFGCDYNSKYYGFDLSMELGSSGDLERYNILSEHLRSNPKDVGALVEFGALCAVVFEGPREAGPALERAIEIDKNINIEAYYWLAWTHLYGRGDAQSAKEVLERALIIDEENLEYQNLMICAVEGLYRGWRKWHEYSIERDLEKNPSWIAPHINMGNYFLHEEFDIEKAQHHLNEAIQKSKNLKKMSFSEKTKQYYARALEKRNHDWITKLAREIEEVVKDALAK
ncbi:hypothetical protein ACFLY6_00560 [Candidatus Dependentiae bacterium]